MKYLWILLIPVLAFAGLKGDKDRDRDLRNRNLPGDTQERAGDDPLPSGGGVPVATSYETVPWEQIDRWLIFEGLSKSQVLWRLEAMTGGRPSEPGKFGGLNPHFGWSRFFNPTYHSRGEPHMIRFHSIPKRKKGHGNPMYILTGDGRSSRRVEVTSYWETCRAWTARVKGYWRKYYGGEDVPQLPCTPEPLPEHPPEPYEQPDDSKPFKPKPPPKGSIITQMKAPPVGPTTDKGVRTTHSASDGRPAYQDQNNPGYHRAVGSATLSSGQVVVDINTSVGAGRNDLSFQSVDSYFGTAWSTDTTNTNSYIVYPLSRTQILIKSSSGADAATVNYRVMGD